MGIEVTEGRDFRQEDGQMVHIFNDAARKEWNLELNSSTSSGEIIGFTSNIKYASFRSDVRSMVFTLNPPAMIPTGAHLNTAYIKLKAGVNLRDAVSNIKTTLSKFDGNYIFNVRFFDETLQQLYKKEIALNLLITLLCIISIFISIVGIFGLVVFDSESRRKEVGIRKVHGASTFSIILMFNKAYFKILVISYVIAAPLAWYAVNQWLQNFVFRTPVYGWVYLLSFITLVIITSCTVTFQNWRVANENPVNSIKIG